MVRPQGRRLSRRRVVSCFWAFRRFTRRLQSVADALGALVLGIAALAILGYAYGVRDLYAIPIFSDDGASHSHRNGSDRVGVGSCTAQRRMGAHYRVEGRWGGGNQAPAWFRSHPSCRWGDPASCHKRP